MPEIIFHSLGGVTGIGASAHLLKLADYQILLDAGCDPAEEGPAAMPDYSAFSSRAVQAIVVTHAHLDHIGSLPAAIKNFPYARVYMTPSTAELTELMLHHYLHVQRKRFHQNVEAPFTREDIELVRYLFQSFEYEHHFPLHGYEESGIEFSLYDAGHILGSAGVLIEWQGRRIFYAGNTRKSPQFILPGARYPRGRLDVLITEATYGANAAAAETSLAQETRRFAEVTGRHLDQAGILLLPVFALGRTQEMIAMLHQLRVAGRIPAVPIYLTGFGYKILKIYDRYLGDIYPKFAGGSLERMMFASWHPGRQLKGPAILIATSGMMLPGSPSFRFVEKLSSDPRNAICFVGYTDPATPGSVLQQGDEERIRSVFGLPKVDCAVERFTFSAHSNRLELLEMIEALNPRTVIFVHGDREALQWMENETRRRNPAVQTLIPQEGIAHSLKI